jgi:small redox-active disulfide protein 2
MIQLKVLGPGCAKCNKLYKIVEQAILSAGVEADLCKVDKLDEIMKYGVMVTPALVLNGEVKSSGKVPKEKDIVAWLTSVS